MTAPTQPTITVAASGASIVVTLTGPSSDANAAEYEVWRSNSDLFWDYRYPTYAPWVPHPSGPLAGWTAPRVAGYVRRANILYGTPLYDYTAESGVAYTYFVRAMGVDGVSSTDSAPASATCALTDTWIVPFASGFSASSPAALSPAAEFRWPQPGAVATPLLEATELQIAGRVWPIVDYGIHETIQLDVSIDCPYGEAVAGFADETVLRAFMLTGAPVVYRDSRGRKVYGRISALVFSDSQYGTMAKLTVQALDLDDSVT